MIFLHSAFLTSTTTETSSSKVDKRVICTPYVSINGPLDAESNKRLYAICFSEYCIQALTLERSKGKAGLVA